MQSETSPSRGRTPSAHMRGAGDHDRTHRGSCLMSGVVDAPRPAISLSGWGCGQEGVGLRGGPKDSGAPVPTR